MVELVHAVKFPGSHRPNVRAVVELLTTQSGPRWQDQGWGTLDDCYAIIFDELELDKRLDDAEGIALARDELPAARELVNAMEELYGQVTLGCDSSPALRAPSWSRVVAAAAALLRKMNFTDQQ